MMDVTSRIQSLPRSHARVHGLERGMLEEIMLQNKVFSAGAS